MKRRILSFLLAVCTILSILPGPALAVQPETTAAAAAGTVSPQAQTPATWRFLFVILKKNNITYRDVNGKTQRETTAMTSAEVSAIKYAANQFKSWMTKEAGGLVKPIIQIVEIDRPITQLSATHIAYGLDDSLWLTWSDCLPLIQSRADVSRFDHVFAIAALNTIETSYRGLTSSVFPQGIGYSFVNTDNKAVCVSTLGSSNRFPCGVFVHEFLHFADTWSRARTGAAPTVNNHQATEMGYTDGSAFYADLINKRVLDTNGKPAGIEPAAWANPPVSFRNGIRTATVTFHSNGGYRLPDSSRTKTVTNGKTYGALPTPEYDGYTFMGWFTSTAGGVQVKASDKVSLAGDQTLYAHWTPKAGSNNYTVTLDPNGGVISTTRR